MLEPGTILEGRFQVLSLVGEGGMGAVFRGVDEATGGRVAIKVLKATADTAGTERFLREAKLLSGLDHPGIVSFRHVGATATGAFLVMEWLEGEDLGARLAGRGVTFLETVRAARGVAEALASTHAHGLVHRDVKPHNIFLVGGRADQVKILDFGIARAGPASSALTHPGTAIGTPAYMAPEQARGGERVDGRADLFSLGCVLYECLAGAPPFWGDSPIACLAQVLLSDPPRIGASVPGVPKELDVLVMSMLSKDPEGRPESAAAVARELGAMEPLLATAGSAGAVSSRHVSLAEKRVASIVLARDLSDAGPRADGDTLLLAEVRAALDAAKSVVDKRGGRVTALWDGTLLGSFSGAGTAADLAKTAATAALALRDVAPGRGFAVTTDLAEVTGSTATGAAVSRAFGLASLPGMIRVDATTRALVHEAFTLRGVAGGCELLAERTEPASTSSDTVVGRKRELGMLHASLEAVRDDEQARTVVVLGPVGQGKTCLLRELRSTLEAAADGVRWCFVSCEPAHSDVGFSVACAVLRALLGLDVTASPADQRRALRAWAEPALGPSDTQFLEWTLRIADENQPLAQDAAQDPRLLAERTLGEWVRVLGALASNDAVVIILDDLHACDAQSARLLERALGELEDAQLLLVAAARPDLDEVHPRLFADRQLDKIQLAPLPRRASEALVRSKLGATAPAEQVRAIVENGAGNPLFMLELAAAALEGASAAPTSVVALLQERLERLEANARRVLRAASIFGDVFWQEGVCALVGDSDALTVASWLDELTRRDFLERRATSRFSGQTELAFRHVLVRDAAYATLTDADLTVGHRLAASWLEQMADPEPLTVARHFALGRDLARAAPHWLRAARALVQQNDAAKALELVERIEALPAEDRRALSDLDLDCVAAKALFWTGQQRRCIERAGAALPRAAFGTAAWLDLATLHLRALGQLEDPRLPTVLAALLPELERHPAAPRPFAALPEVVMSLLRLGDTPLAARAVEILGGDAATPLAKAHLLRAKSWLAMYSGEIDACVDLDHASIEAFEAAGNRSEALAARASTAYAHMMLGRWELARAEFERTAKEAMERGAGRVTQVALHNLGLVHLQLGDPERAIAVLHEAIAAVDDPETPLHRFSSCYLAMTRLEQGRLDDCAQAIAGYERWERSTARTCAMATCSRAAARAGEPERALELARGAMAELVALGSIEEGEFYVRNSLTLALSEAGLAAEAAERAKEAEAALRGIAARIKSPEARASFLHRVAAHQETVALASELVRGAGAPPAKSERA